MFELLEPVNNKQKLMHQNTKKNNKTNFTAVSNPETAATFALRHLHPRPITPPPTPQGLNFVKVYESYYSPHFSSPSPPHLCQSLARGKYQIFLLLFHVLHHRKSQCED